MNRVRRSLLLLLAVLSLSCSPQSGVPGAPAAQPQAAQTPQTPEETPTRQPAKVMSWTGADWLEREHREELEKPEVVLKAMGLKDGDLVADLGAGTGFFTRRMARAVAPSGKVYATDIQPQMLERLKASTAQEGIANIVTVLGTETDPRLPEGMFDWILLVDVYHEFQQPEPMLAKIREALKPGGRVALVEYRAEGDTAKHIDAAHKMTVEQVLAEWNPAGFELIETIEDLPSQHLFIFTARAAR